jgi:chemotaxis protein CheD
MSDRAFQIDIFLQPGEWWFGDRSTRIRTVLGSCVSITLWHADALLGGMCHYMLPMRPLSRKGPPDARYADDAIALLLEQIRRSGTDPRDYQAKMFGGGDMFPGGRRRGADQVGARNIEAGRQLLRRHGFTCRAEHLGGAGHRNLIFEVWSGDVWVRHTNVTTPAEDRTR